MRAAAENRLLKPPYRASSDVEFKVRTRRPTKRGNSIHFGSVVDDDDDSFAEISSYAALSCGAGDPLSATVLAGVLWVKMIHR